VGPDAHSAPCAVPEPRPRTCALRYVGPGPDAHSAPCAHEIAVTNRARLVERCRPGHENC
jgi:hypothetical protein